MGRLLVLSPNHNREKLKPEIHHKCIFVPKGTEMYCFEPDEVNKKKLIKFYPKRIRGIDIFTHHTKKIWNAKRENRHCVTKDPEVMENRYPHFDCSKRCIASSEYVQNDVFATQPYHGRVIRLPQGDPQIPGMGISGKGEDEEVSANRCAGFQT